jgi:hypothetical protein
VKSKLKNLFGIGAAHSIGDPVAVCCPRGTSFVVYPKTMVEDRRYFDGKTLIQNRSGETGRPAKGWWYSVTHESHTFFHERFVRPYKDDDYKDHKEETKPKEVPV